LFSLNIGVRTAHRDSRLWSDVLLTSISRSALRAIHSLSIYRTSLANPNKIRADFSK
jgi:hypothetical protein